MSEIATPPRAPREPHRLEKHGHERIDPYFWMRDREDPRVRSHLEAENAWCESSLAHLSELREDLFGELKERLVPDDQTAPYRLDGFYYYHRWEPDREYSIYCRREGSLEAPEEIILDVNELAEGRPYCQIKNVRLSLDHRLLAYGVDTVGRRIYRLRIKDLKTGEHLVDEIPETSGNLTWASDNKTLFYVRQDLTTLRSCRVYRHELGTDPQDDPLIFEETDPTFAVSVSKSKSRKFIFIGSYQTLSSEIRLLDAERPTEEPKVFLPRSREHEYAIDHGKGCFWIHSNDSAKNFRLFKCPEDQIGREHWEEVVAHRDDVLLENFELFADHLILEERSRGLTALRVRNLLDEQEHLVEFEEPAYVARVGINPEFDVRTLRFSYASMTTPPSVYEYDLESRERVLLKRQEVRGGFKPSEYRTERLFATAKDGVRIPISLVYRENVDGAAFAGDGARPLLLYGYGSYGHSLDPSFATTRISLLDRGFVFAIAHIRGGEELGRAWYDDGKMGRKMNTFTDFIACAEFLADEGYADRDRLYAMGGSAGGLLVGAVMNLRPELFHGVVAAVPFVDVLTTMLDETLPLTTGEYDEWGNPNLEEDYRYILSYSPYDNLEAKEYPHLLVTSGLHDSQVQYWEPTKWVAKLRELKTDDRLLLLKTNLEAGHSGASGRYAYLREIALQYSFLIDLAGVEKS